MARKVCIERGKGDLVGAAEAAYILGAPVTSVTRWRKAGKMPPPVEELKSTHVWLRADIEAMARERRSQISVRT